uniref:Protein pelota homolog n=1 Tax=Sinocyclocheilus grahami TaxID=75366 RepID=A0A672Q9V1_SINGR
MSKVGNTNVNISVYCLWISSSQVTLIPEEAEDMWHTYNLLHVGDSLRASTIRKVQTESSTGSVGSSRVRTTLTLCVATIDFDSQALERFYEAVMQGILRHFNFDVVKCVLVASPGFVKDQFISYLFKEAVRQDCKILLENRSKFMVVHSSSGHKYSLKEVLCDPAVTALLSDTKAAGEVKALEDFYKMLQQEPDRAFYGLAHVERASEALAIDILMISDKLFRHQDIATRSRYVRLVDNVKENGGNVRIFSSLHVSGEQLNQLSGVVAVLRFPIADMSEAEEDSSSDED